MQGDLIKVLIFRDELIAELKEVFRKEKVKTFYTNDVEESLKLIESESIDVFIFNSTDNIDESLQFYEKHQNSLINASVSFFILAEEFEREDLLIALELGIDNVIFWPLKTESLVRKIEHAHKKRKSVNIFKTRDFSTFFRLTHTPMAIVKGGGLIKLNNALKNIFPTLTSFEESNRIEDIFNIEISKANLLEYKRFKNGLSNSCYLPSIPIKSVKDYQFNLFFFRPSQNFSMDYLLEIYPSKKRISSDGNGIEPRLNSYAKLEIINLTKREKEIFELSALGLPIKIIAEKLGLSNRTIERHRANIMHKAGAKNIIEAIAYFREKYILN